ncbi:uncharacterized protein LOC114525155 [Dendronephthya gigantea]|uniref:uncharacterized protein LOC114525155 n=1 Tax=Dendronephthya gigantea TaxID=151771 RepID=UPI00106A1035|nr:uncharacterized protein LOC114525155 [Dendronephthya gigantea]
MTCSYLVMSTLEAKCLWVLLFLYFGPVCFGKKSEESEVLLCRQCGHNIVDSREVVDIKSILALKYKNASVLGPKGTLVQTFKNPEGINFDVITVSKASIQEHGDAHEKFSWFPGYAWKLAGCPRCRAHLGWTFTSTDEDDDEEDYDDDDDHDIERPIDKYQKPKRYSFAGLILSRLIRESFADSLIVPPKVYQR